MSHPHKLIIRLAALLLIAALVSVNVSQVDAIHQDRPKGQVGIVVENAAVKVNYGQAITFSAKITAPLPIKQASILFRGVNEEVTRVETLQIDQGGLVSFTYDASLNVFPPFSYIVFWFQAALDDGNTYTSSPITFPYNDDRFPWRAVTRDNINVHWYAGDDAFGAGALDAAYRGASSMNDYFPVSSEPIDIYIYSNEQDLQTTLSLGGESWAGGHANPALGVAMVAIAPGEGQSLEMETEIPHELAHVLLYHSLGNKYARQPVWLLEGIAKLMELTGNPDDARALKIASDNDTLLAFEDLCDSFPADAGNAFLAYAQSRSFVAYIRDTYGISGLTRLTDIYGDGYDCELGATNALGTPLSQLDKRWRENVLGQNVMGLAINNLSPFVLLMALVMLVPLWGAIDMVRKRRRHARNTK